MRTVKGVCGIAALGLLLRATAAEAGVEISVRESEKRVEVAVDGRPFTAYLWGSGQKKPILFPLHTDRGVPVTRGFPLEPRPGERTDHPHHAGLWLNYGDVDGVDFWNNSDSHARSASMGTVEHRAVGKTEGGKRGVLEVELEWKPPGGRAVLREDVRFVFAAGRGQRLVDRVTTLTAMADRVVFGDSKEGLLGLRLARFLEDPEGRYFTSEGKTAAEAWGTRGRWAAVEGQHDGRWVTVAIIDHPENPGHPTYWHARGYGLFAANPLGRRSFDETQAAGQTVLARGETARFVHRVWIVSGRRSPADIEKEYRRFSRANP